MFVCLHLLHLHVDPLAPRSCADWGGTLTTLARRDVRADEMSVLGEAISRLPQASRLAEALESLRSSLDQGVDVVVSSIEEEVSPNGVARLLGVSRPTVYRLMDSGDLPFRTVGSHRRIRMREVLTYRRRQETARCELAEVFAHSGENETALVRRLADVDEETAKALGF